jgi:hypothetical protein
VNRTDAQVEPVQHDVCRKHENHQAEPQRLNQALPSGCGAGPRTTSWAMWGAVKEQRDRLRPLVTGPARSPPFNSVPTCSGCRLSQKEEAQPDIGRYHRDRYAPTLWNQPKGRVPLSPMHHAANVNPTHAEVDKPAGGAIASSPARRCKESAVDSI